MVSVDYLLNGFCFCTEHKLQSWTSLMLQKKWFILSNLVNKITPYQQEWHGNMMAESKGRGYVHHVTNIFKAYCMHVAMHPFYRLHHLTISIATIAPPCYIAIRHHISWEYCIIRWVVAHCCKYSVAKNDLASFAVLLQWQVIVYSDNFLTEHWPCSVW